MFERSTFGSRDPDTTDKQIDALIDEAEGAGAMVREATGPVAALVAVHRLTVTALVEVLRTSLEPRAPESKTPLAGAVDGDREVIERTVEEADHGIAVVSRSEFERLSASVAALLRRELARVASLADKESGPPAAPSDAEIDAMEAMGVGATTRMIRLTFHISGQPTPVPVNYSSDNRFIDVLRAALAVCGIANSPEEYDSSIGVGAGVMILDTALSLDELGLDFGDIITATLKPVV